MSIFGISWGPAIICPALINKPSAEERVKGVAGNYDAV
jgi:hypothetical protein